MRFWIVSTLAFLLSTGAAAAPLVEWTSEESAAVSVPSARVSP